MTREICTLIETMDTLAWYIKNDDDYAWSWHCNLAMMAYDAGATHREANIGASNFMKTAFDVDTTTSKYYQEIMRRLYNE